MKGPAKLHVAITGFSAADNPYPGLAIARCLRESADFSGKISALVFDPRANGAFYRGVVDSVYLTPSPAAGKTALLERICHIHKKNPISSLIPALDSEVILFSQISRELDSQGIRTLLPPADSIKLRAKHILYEFCRENGIKTPRTLILNNVEEIRAASRETGIPFVLKAVLCDGKVCKSVAAGEEEYLRLLSLWGYPVLIQEYIGGEEFDVALLADRNSQTAGAVVIKKIGITDQGKAYAAVTVHDQNLLNICNHIIKLLQWIGPVELEFIRDKKGEFHIIEINSRFPSWIYLTACSGQNLPLACVKLGLGMPSDLAPAYQEGKLFFRTVHDCVITESILFQLTVSGEVTL